MLAHFRPFVVRLMRGVGLHKFVTHVWAYTLASLGWPGLGRSDGHECTPYAHRSTNGWHRPGAAKMARTMRPWPYWSVTSSKGDSLIRWCSS